MCHCQVFVVELVLETWLAVEWEIHSIFIVHPGPNVVLVSTKNRLDRWFKKLVGVDSTPDKSRTQGFVSIGRAYWSRAERAR